MPFFVKTRQHGNDDPCRGCDIPRSVFAEAFFRRGFWKVIQVDVTPEERRDLFRDHAAKKDFSLKIVETAFFAID